MEKKHKIQEITGMREKAAARGLRIGKKRIKHRTTRTSKKRLAEYDLNVANYNKHVKKYPYIIQGFGFEDKYFKTHKDAVNCLKKFLKRNPYWYE